MSGEEDPEGKQAPVQAKVARRPTGRRARKRVEDLSDAFRPEEIHPIRPADPHVVSLLDPGSFAAEQYKMLRHLVERAYEVRGLRIVAVTSPAPGDGKTLTALNLAGALAQGSRQKILLVDADFRRPSTLARLGLEDGPREEGLGRMATDPATSLGDVVRYCPEFHLFVLPPGQVSEAPYDLLSSPLLGRFVHLAREQFHYVVIDTPPAVGFPDYRVLEKWVDGSFLVVAAGRTPRRMVEQALKVVNPTKCIGIVFNRADVRRVAKYYEKYYREKREARRLRSRELSTPEVDSSFLEKGKGSRNGPDRGGR